MRTVLLLLFLSGCTPHALSYEELLAASIDKEECEALAAEMPAGLKALDVKNECLTQRYRARHP
jgi:hypothetical protein